jgi:regulator of protease activity HflC (stomatin/prohibitin superfamily)
METFLAFFDRIFVWVPRIEIVRSTHGGVKWRTRLTDDEVEPEVIEIKPGLHWYWPLVSELEFIVTARRPVDIPTMSILTKDGISVIVSAAVVFRINDVIKALGEKNWDVDSTLVDVTQSVIFRAVRSRTFRELLDEKVDDLIDELTESTKKGLSKFGILVESVLPKDFDQSKSYRVFGETASFLTQEEDDE